MVRSRSLRIVLTTLLTLGLLAVLMTAAGAKTTLRVGPDGSIAQALDRAEPGTVIEVEPGVYREELLVDRADITLRGIVRGDSRPVLAGENKRDDGVIVTEGPFTMSGFKIKNYRGNGVTTQGVKGVELRDLVIRNTGVYGVYPVRSEDIVIKHCVASGIRDAALYVGESRRALVAHNQVHDNVAGIEIENTIHATVRDNYAHNNTAGILVFVLPGKQIKATRNVTVTGNVSVQNNTENFGDTASVVGRLPRGLGMLVMGADSTAVKHNWFSGNGSLGAAVVRLPEDQAKQDPALDPASDHTRLGPNYYHGNGLSPHPLIRRDFGGGGDIGWDGTGTGNCTTAGKKVQRAGAPLPTCPGAGANGRQGRSGKPGTAMPSPGE